jgi:hypothetical protein
MRTILAACVALSAVGFAVASPAQADVAVQTPGVTVQSAPFWRGHDNDWRDRREFRESEYQREPWLRDHCVRDWAGKEFCRR